MTGVVQLFVGSFTFTSSGSCEGDATSVDAAVADALCHPITRTDGSTTQWRLVNCNGGKPFYKTCSDSACKKNCQQTQFDGTCQSMGAGSSKLVQCIAPPGKSILDFSFGDESDASSIHDGVVSGWVLALGVGAWLLQTRR
jgi:hypothetical protein